jgi:RNA polymerase sigma-70 factor (ECF subfamily)
MDKVALTRAERDILDLAAITRLVAGDETALAELYDRYAGVALGLAARIVGVRSEAEDVVHDAFVALTERACQYKPERGAVATWILTTIRNLSIDRARGRSRQREIINEELALEPQAPSDDPEETSGLAQDGRLVRAALAKLNEAQRSTLEDAFFEGLSYPEIAERRGVPLGTVKSRATRALSALRAILENNGEELPPSKRHPRASRARAKRLDVPAELPPNADGAPLVRVT